MRSERHRQGGCRRVLLALGLLLGSALAASAQQKPYVEPYLELFLRAGATDARNANNPVFIALAKSVGRVVFIKQGPLFLNHLLLSQVGTYPVPTSSGAFSYSFDPISRSFIRRASSFGPTFVERATTLGHRGSVSLGMSLEPLHFQSFNDAKLSDAPLYARFRYLDGRVATRSLSMDLRTETVSIFGTIAATPSFDVQVVVPFSRVSYRGIVSFEDGTRFDTGMARSTGLGDVEVRARWSGWRTARGEAGAEYGVRLPTGKDAVHSLERAQQKLTGLATVSVGRVQLHANGGYVFRVGGKSPGDAVSSTNPLPGFLPTGSLPTEATYGAAAEVAPHSRLTVSAEVYGRYIFDTIRFTEITEDLSEPSGYYRDSLEPVRTNTAVALAAVGAKYQIVGDTLLTWHVLIPLTSGGLRPAVTSVVGWELGF